MIVGILKVTFRLHGIFSLKEKRKISSSLKQKLRNKYNISIAEVENQDSTDFLTIGVSTLSNEMRQTESILSKVKDSIEAMTSEEIVEINTDFFGY
ncbi:MAG: hypothetical protein XD41_0402 [Desulfonauticus sp. 38_4375]|nr:MAG: hypothetical protein XD41_0402 [Desulfonauticus sp. 38_4375]